MKIIDLIKSLHPEEQKIIEQKLKKDQPTLFLLWKEIKQCSSEEVEKNKAKIYRKISGLPWQEKADGAWRNLLSRLFQFCRTEISFIWEEEKFDRSVFQTKAWLENLIRRRSFELFEKEWNYFFELYNESQNCKGLSILYEVKMQFLYQQEFNVNKLKELQDCFQKSHVFLKTDFIEQELNLFYYKSFVENLSVKVNNPIRVSTENSHQTTNYIRFLTTYLKFFSEPDINNKAMYIENAIQYETFIKKYKPNSVALIKSAVVNMGVEAYTHFNYTLADTFLNHFMSSYFNSSDERTRQIVVLTAYSNKLQLKKHEEGLVIYKQLSENIKEPSVYLNRIHLIHALNLLFLNRISEAFVLVQQVLQNTAEVFTELYCRILLSVVFYKEKNFHFAIRETENIIKINSYESAQTKTERFAASLYLKFYKIVQTPDVKNRNKKLSLLPELWKSESAEMQSSLLIRWLENEINLEVHNEKIKS